MRYTKVEAKEGYVVDVAAIVNASIAVRALARTNRNVAAANFVGELADVYLRWFMLLLEAAVAHVERAQRVADRFRTWRASKQDVPPLLGEPDPIGSSSRRIRRFGDATTYVNAVLRTTLAVRALDREEGTDRELRFVGDLDAAFAGNALELLEALVLLAERDRRFARRFRSWRRAKAARAASPRDAGVASPRRSRARPR